MKLLVISNNLSRPSYRQRIGSYIIYLNQLGITAEVHQLPKNNFARWKLFKHAGVFDGVLLHKKCLNYIDAALLKKFSKKIIYDFDDAIMYSPNKPGKKSSHYRLFKRTAKMVDAMIAGNAYLAKHAGKFCSDVHILPTGLDTNVFSEFKKPTENDNKIRLVWIGSKSTLKYLADLKPMLEDVGKENPDVILRIIADDFIDLNNMQIEKSKWSLESQIPGLLTSDIGLAPLPENQFTRGKCGFKILQYFAASLPVVASPVGVNEDFIEQSKAGFTARTDQDWKNAITELIHNRQLRNDMGVRAAQYVNNFNSDVIGKRFANLVHQAINK